MLTMEALGDFNWCGFDFEDEFVARKDFAFQVVDQNNNTLYWYSTGPFLIRHCDDFYEKYNISDTEITRISYDRDIRTITFHVNTEVHYSDFLKKRKKLEEDDYYGDNTDENTIAQFLKVLDKGLDIRVLLLTESLDDILLYDKDNEEAFVKSEKKLLKEYDYGFEKLTFSCTDEKFVFEIVG